MTGSGALPASECERAWTQQSVIWLPGVRGVGKTTLCISLDDVEYLDCELPRQRRRLGDPESFLASVSGERPEWLATRGVV